MTALLSLVTCQVSDTPNSGACGPALARVYV